MNKLFIVSECYSCDGVVSLGLSEVYDTYEGAEKCLSNKAHNARYDIEHESLNLTNGKWTCVDDDTNYWRADLDEYNWHVCEIHEIKMSGNSYDLSITRRI